MHKNLKNILKPVGHKEGRTLKLAAVMVLALGVLAVIFVSMGVTWENDRRLITLVGTLAVFYIAAIPLGMLRTRQNLRKNFDRFTEAQLRQMDMEYQNTTPICGVVVTSYALACEKNLIPISDIVWVYEQNTTQSGVVTLNCLIVIDKNHKQHLVPLSAKAGPFRKANQEAVQEIEARLLRHSPGIYCGYSKEIVQMYRKNFAGMIAHVEEKLSQCNYF